VSRCGLTTDVEKRRATGRRYACVCGRADAEVMQRRRALEGAIVSTEDCRSARIRGDVKYQSIRQL
jgi:hypothetical protein